MLYSLVIVSFLINPLKFNFNTAFVPDATLQQANAGTTLEDTAATMQPGTWAELNTIGFNNGQLLSPAEFGCKEGDSINQYADSATWDPVQKRFMFIGTTHGYCHASKFVVYQDNTNTWSTGPWIPGECQSGVRENGQPCGGHSNDHNTVDPATGDFYFRRYATKQIYKFSATDGTSSFELRNS